MQKDILSFPRMNDIAKKILNESQKKFRNKN